jgi:succinate dehydrogenase / fumarate reductase membrane anchor subunit
MASFRTPLGRVRGLGAAKHGVGSFIVQRVTAAALVLLVLWGIDSALVIAHMDYRITAIWLQSPWNAVPAALLIGIGFLHMHIGMREIVIDYIAKTGTRNTLLLLNLFICAGGAALGVFCVLKVAFLGGGYY